MFIFELSLYQFLEQIYYEWDLESVCEHVDNKTNISTSPQLAFILDNFELSLIRHKIFMIDI